MNKKALIIVSIIIGIIVVGGIIAYTISQNNKQDKMAMEKKVEDEAMMNKEVATSTENDAMANEEHMMSGHGSYVTLSEYSANPIKYADATIVYFFHASWCPICQGIDKEIKKDISKVPANVTIIKTDFDNSADLRKKFGVTTQYTFVQVDENNNETAQWSATNLDKAIAGIK